MCDVNYIYKYARAVGEREGRKKSRDVYEMGCARGARVINNRSGQVMLRFMDFSIAVKVYCKNDVFISG